MIIYLCVVRRIEFSGTVGIRKYNTLPSVGYLQDQGQTHDQEQREDLSEIGQYLYSTPEPDLDLCFVVVVHMQ